MACGNYNIFGSKHVFGLLNQPKKCFHTAPLADLKPPPQSLSVTCTGPEGL